MSSPLERRMQEALEERQEKGSLRRLPADPSLDGSLTDAPDFSSNDYLGFSHNGYLNTHQHQKRADQNEDIERSGSTGSRLLAGDSPQFHRLEQRLAAWHGVPYGLLCNSGYDANLSVVSCLAADIIFYDAYIHNSLHMGIRLWKGASCDTARTAHSFRHNSVPELERLFKKEIQRKENKSSLVVTVLIESVYSMDGDIAPVRAILDLAAQYGAHVVVDEAHGWGVLGQPKGLGALEDHGSLMHHPALAYAIYTYGKAAGAHGAFIGCPNRTARDYLVNYAYPFIYSTALPDHSLRCIEQAYETLDSPYGVRMRHHVQELIAYFRSELGPFLLSQLHDPQRTADTSIRLLPSTTPIQALLVPGNAACTQLCHDVLHQDGMRLFPIKSPTVPVGMERVRIILHGHNTKAQVARLVLSLQAALLRLQVGSVRSHEAARPSRSKL